MGSPADQRVGSEVLGPIAFRNVRQKTDLSQSRNGPLPSMRRRSRRPFEEGREARDFGLAAEDSDLIFRRRSVEETEHPQDSDFGLPREPLLIRCHHAAYWWFAGKWNPVAHPDVALMRLLHIRAEQVQREA